MLFYCMRTSLLFHNQSRITKNMFVKASFKANMDIQEMVARLGFDYY